MTGGSSEPRLRDLVIKVIKTEGDYEAALAMLETLLDAEPASGTPDAERLELLTLLVEDYEAKVAPPELPDPIEAIRFRMEQQGLRQRDLVPYIGSPSKVSEVLSGKRPLTLSMIRALHAGLGIPAHVLLQETQRNEEQLAISWDRFPLAEMAKRGWVTGLDLRHRGEEVIREFFAPVGGPSALSALYRKGQRIRSGRPVDQYALAAWTARVMRSALEAPLPSAYVPGTVTREFMTEVARLSWFEQGPRLASEFLSKHGISVVIEPHLPQTHLDGAALLVAGERPVIGLTIRHDRLDNFWFCLMHELAHIALHLTPESEKDAPAQFFDDLDASPGDDVREIEADTAADEALIPEDEWLASPASKVRAPAAVQFLAKKLRIHPAIVAGRIRYRNNDYRIMTELVGQGEVRRLFPEMTWI
jgi:HTH-type transcriptional regulator / antitoxin HigA